MGGTNLEIFKFGMYIMFPIAWMYYFGTNLDERFSVPDFWPTADQSNKIPFDKSEIRDELARLQQERLYNRRQRLIMEGKSEAEADVAIATPTVKGRSAGGMLDNSAAAAWDKMKSKAGGVSGWFGRS